MCVRIRPNGFRHSSRKLSHPIHRFPPQSPIRPHWFSSPTHHTLSTSPTYVYNLFSHIYIIYYQPALVIINDSFLSFYYFADHSFYYQFRWFVTLIMIHAQNPPTRVKLLLVFQTCYDDCTIIFRAHIYTHDIETFTCDEFASARKYNCLRLSIIMTPVHWKAGPTSILERLYFNSQFLIFWI